MRFTMIVPSRLTQTPLRVLRESRGLLDLIIQAEFRRRPNL
jgi:hypothetical protein